MTRITMPYAFQDKKVMLKFDYTSEDYYGKTDSLWIHGWTGENGITGKINVFNSEHNYKIVEIAIAINTLAYGQ